MHPLKLLIFKFFIYIFTLIYSVGFCMWLLFYFVTHPTKKFWKVQTREKPPQCLLDPSWGNHGYMQLKDIRLHYVENGNRSKPLMLFIHGFPEFWYSWRHQLKYFGENYWAVALDLRGYGESDKPESMSSYKIKYILEDIEKFILGLGRDKVILVGHDWGGLLVWNFLDCYPLMVEKLVVLDSPHHKTWTKMLIRKPKQFVLSWYCFFFQMPYLPEFALSLNDFKKFNILLDDHGSKGSKNVSLDDLEVFKYVFSKPNALKYAINYYRANCGDLYVKDDDLESYPPVLMIFGENEHYLLLSFINYAKKEVTNLKSAIIKNASHFVQQDNPDGVNETIRNFLEEETVTY